MTQLEDYREKKDGDDADFLAGEDENQSEKEDGDEAALLLDGRNPLAKEEKIEEDDSGSD